MFLTISNEKIFFQNTQLRSRIHPVNTMKIKILGNLRILYMVIFQSSFVILRSTNGSLYKFDCNISVMGTETNSSLDTVAEQTIFNYLPSSFLHTSTKKFVVLWNIYYFPKRLSYQFLAFKDIYIQTKLRNKLLKELNLHI